MKKLKLVATGDALITMRQSVHEEQEFLEMVDIIRNSDIAFTNLEMLLHNYDDDCYPAAECGGTYTRAQPEIIEDLMWMGFDLYGTANNHSLDYMYGGLLSTIDWLDSQGLTHAGTGRDLADARMPSYLESKVGRVALICAASTFAGFGRAGDARRDMKGRPGLNPLRYDTWYEARPETLEKLKEVYDELALQEVHQEEGSYHFLGKKFVPGEDVGVHTKPNEKDMEGNLEAVREAVKQSDWVVFSLHAHESRNGEPERPAEFIEEFARSTIDAGAHAFIGHGHHAMRGIEIRDGCPIFYSLGNFIFQNETVQKMPADFYDRYFDNPYEYMPGEAFNARQDSPPRPGYPEHLWFTEDEKYWMSFLPEMTFKGDELSSLILHPIELGQNKPRSQRGRPMLADEELSEKILGTISDLSKAYGTEIKSEDGVGYVEL
ncbi:MAG: CapA family protein [Candidatus Bathyarchaeia archaeon]